MTQPFSLELKVELMIADLAAQKQKIEENKREFDADLQRVTDMAEAEIAEANKKIAALEDERNKALKWGVMTLGSAVLGMAYWIVEKIVGGHIK